MRLKAPSTLLIFVEGTKLKILSTVSRGKTVGYTQSAGASVFARLYRTTKDHFIRMGKIRTEK
jgi:hypothetical protein